MTFSRYATENPARAYPNPSDSSVNAKSMLFKTEEEEADLFFDSVSKSSATKPNHSDEAFTIIILNQQKKVRLYLNTGAQGSIIPKSLQLNVHSIYPKQNWHEAHQLYRQTCMYSRIHHHTILLQMQNYHQYILHHRNEVTSHSLSLCLYLQLTKFIL